MTGIPGNFVARIPGGGGTPPRGARLANGALIARAGGNPLAVRTGVLADGGGPVVTGTSGMSYRVRAFSGAVGQTSTLTNGPTVTPNDGEVIVPTDPAPGANSRIDVIYIWQRLLEGDGGSESTNQPIIAVKVGDVSATPVAKSIPDGAVELGRATVTAGAQATAGLTITPGRWTVATGGMLPDADGRIPSAPVFQVVSKRWGADFNPALHAPKRLSWTTSVPTTAAGIAAIVADLRTYFIGVSSVQMTGAGASDALRSAKAVITGNTLEAYCYGPGGTGVVGATVAIDVSIDGWV